MRNLAKVIQTLCVAALLSLVATGALGQKSQDLSSAPASENSSETRLRLVDGSSIGVDEAWESEQGIWYRLGGMSHLIAKDRV